MARMTQQDQGILLRSRGGPNNTSPHPSTALFIEKLPHPGRYFEQQKRNFQPTLQLPSLTPHYHPQLINIYLESHILLTQG